MFLYFNRNTEIALAARKSKTATRDAIIQSAGKLFAEKGFKETTVRAVCKDAGVNVAAVNYHFNGKEHLFEEILKYAINRQWKKHPPDAGFEKKDSPKTRLRKFVKTAVKRRFDHELNPWFGRLITREAYLASHSAHKAVQKNLGKSHSILREIVSELLGPRAKKKDVDFCMLSAIGQFMIFFKPPFVAMDIPSVNKIARENIDEISKHLNMFILAGIEKAKKEITSRRRKKK